MQLVRRRHVAVLLVLAIVGVVAQPSRGAGTLVTEQAYQADQFVDSIGVNTHFQYTTGSMYGNGNLPGTGAAQTEALIEQAGIRHIRDDGNPGQDTGGYIEKFEALGAAGVKLDIGFSETADTKQSIQSLNSLMGSYEDACEGPNEPEYNNGPSWQAPTLAFQKLLATACAPGLQKINFSASDPSIGDLSHIVDACNVHSYKSSSPPETAGYGDNGYGSIQYDLILGKMNAWAKPCWATEHGYGQVADTDGVPEYIQARYELRDIFTNWNAGIPRSYKYEFADYNYDSSAIYQNHGLIRYNGQPKAAYTGIRNLIYELQDIGPAFTTGSLTYAFGGSTGYLNHLLLQKRDGTFYLAYWIGRADWQGQGMSDNHTANQAITLNVGNVTTTGTQNALFGDDGSVTHTSVTFSSGVASLTARPQIQIVELPADAGTAPAAIPGATNPPSPLPTALPAVPVPASSAQVTFTEGVTPANVNLTNAANSNSGKGGGNGWVLAAPQVEKNGNQTWIDPTPQHTTEQIGSGVRGTYASFPTTFSWTDGPKSASGSSTSGLYFVGPTTSNGVLFVVQEDQLSREALFYYGASCDHPVLTVSDLITGQTWTDNNLASDTTGLTEAYTIVNYTGGQGDDFFTLSLAVGSTNPGCTSSIESDGTGAVAVQAVVAAPAPAQTILPTAAP